MCIKKLEIMKFDWSVFSWFTILILKFANIYLEI